MDHLERKQKELDQLHELFDNMSEIMKLDGEISKQKEMLQNPDEEIKKIKDACPFEKPEYNDPYTKFLYNLWDKRKSFDICFALKKVYLIIYILFGIALVCWTGYQIFSYATATSWEIIGVLDPKGSIIAAIAIYEIILTGVWILGGVIAKWFQW